MSGIKTLLCCECGRHLGEISNGKLHKDIYYICKNCLIKIKQPQDKHNDVEMPDFFKDIFKNNGEKR